MKHKKTKTLRRKCITSYYVTTLMTYAPVEPATDIIKNNLEQVTELSLRAIMSVHCIIQ